MPLPQVRLGDLNSYPAPVIGVKATRILTNGLPSATLGDIVMPHDEDPVHFAVTTTNNPRVLMQGIPVTNVGSVDTFGHVRITGSPNVLT
jgi:uncharacterized Zn-binding protein involved in type VI secretion